jgi:dUTP pyrophosphatase
MSKNLLWGEDGKLRPIVRYKKVDPFANEPIYSTPLSAGFDLAPCDDIHLLPKELTLVSTGLVIATPPGHMLYITFRSSTPRKHGITVLEGIVDEDYCGDDDVLHLQVQNLGGFKTILRGTRIAQGIFVPVTQGHFKMVEEEALGANRGGFGSTG